MSFEILNLIKKKEKLIKSRFHIYSQDLFFIAILYFTSAKQLYIHAPPEYFSTIRPLLINHKFISFMIYIIAFLVFILSLEAKSYKYQFKMFAAIHVVLGLILGAGSSAYYNIFNGLIW